MTSVCAENICTAAAVSLSRRLSNSEPWKEHTRSQLFSLLRASPSAPARKWECQAPFRDDDGLLCLSSWNFNPQQSAVLNWIELYVLLMMANSTHESPSLWSAWKTLCLLPLCHPVFFFFPFLSVFCPPLHILMLSSVSFCDQLQSGMSQIQWPYRFPPDHSGFIGDNGGIFSPEDSSPLCSFPLDCSGFLSSKMSNKNLLFAVFRNVCCSFWIFTLKIAQIKLKSCRSDYIPCESRLFA